MTKESSGRKPRYTSVQTQFFVWERCKSIQKPMKSGKISFNISNGQTGYQELIGIDGKPIEFKWYIFPGLASLQFLQEIQHKMAVCQTSPKEFEDRLIFMSMFNYIDWTEKGNYKECTSNSVTVKNYAKKLQLGHWSSHCMDRCSHQDRSNSLNQNHKLS